MVQIVTHAIDDSEGAFVTCNTARQSNDGVAEIDVVVHDQK